VGGIQAEYQSALASYQARASTYRREVEDHRQALAEWTLERNTAVSKAESLLGRFYDDFGWALVDRDEADEFVPRLLTAWGILVAMIVGLFLLILVAIYRKA
jgi:hypothetical protein